MRSPRILLAAATNMVRSAVFFRQHSGATFASYLDKGVVGRNWGDKLNPVIMEMVGGTRVTNAFGFSNIFSVPIYVAIGSGLAHLAHRHSVVWGHGAGSYTSKIAVPPARIAAVRGPLSREKVLASGLDCPSTYGDPALLLPRYFDEGTAATSRIGVIPHFSHQGSTEVHHLMDLGCKMIDITGDIFQVVRDIRSCEAIASSSLHGLIIADAYGIPSVWIALRAAAIGDGFKFQDHFAAVGHRNRKPLLLSTRTSLLELESHVREQRLDVDLDALLRACPLPGEPHGGGHRFQMPPGQVVDFRRAR